MLSVNRYSIRLLVVKNSNKLFEKQSIANGKIRFQYINPFNTNYVLDCSNIQITSMKYLFILMVAVFFSSTVYAEAQKPSNNADSAAFYFSKAKNSRATRMFIDAEKYFLKAIQFDENNIEIRLEFADYFVEIRKYVLANQQYRAIVENNPKHKVALTKYIELSFLQRRWTEVIKYGEIAFANNVKVAKLNYMMGKSYYEDEDYGKARRYLTAQINETPSDKETVTLLGRVFVEMSMYNDAIAMYKKAIESNPDDYELMYEIGLLYSAQNNDREAVKYYEMAATKGIKQDLAFLQNLGTAYLTFDIPKGVAVLNKVLEKKPGDVEILTQIAQAYYKAGQYATAHELFFKIYENDKRNAKALYMAGLSLIKNGKKEKGAQMCDKAIAMEPQLGDLRTQKSVL